MDFQLVLLLAGVILPAAIDAQLGYPGYPMSGDLGYLSQAGGHQIVYPPAAPGYGYTFGIPTQSTAAPPPGITFGPTSSMGPCIAGPGQYGYSITCGQYATINGPCTPGITACPLNAVCMPTSQRCLMYAAKYTDRFLPNYSCQCQWGYTLMNDGSCRAFDTIAEWCATSDICPAGSTCQGFSNPDGSTTAPVCFCSSNMVWTWTNQQCVSGALPLGKACGASAPQPPTPAPMPYESNGAAPPPPPPPTAIGASPMAGINCFGQLACGLPPPPCPPTYTPVSYQPQSVAAQPAYGAAPTTCQCPVNLVPDDAFHCRMRYAGDQCCADQDCSPAGISAKCISGICTCTNPSAPATWITWQDNTGRWRVRNICAFAGMTASYGQLCSSNVTCVAPYICKGCGGSTMFCDVDFQGSDPLMSAAGGTCKKNTDCPGRSQYCSFQSVSCAQGTCRCQPGFLMKADGTCGRPVQIGQTCYGNDACPMNGNCYNNVCQCNWGYTGSISGWECSTGVDYGQTCYSDDDCANEMVCNQLDWTCECPIGYVHTAGPHCMPRLYGDACQTDADCVYDAAMCNNGTCWCQNPGQVMIKQHNRMLDFEPYAYKSRMTCSGRATLTEDQPCNGDTIQFQQDQTFMPMCMAPYYCVECSTNNWQCSRMYLPGPSTVMAGAPKQFSSWGFLNMLFLASAALLML